MIKKVLVVSLALSVIAFFQMASTCLAETSGNIEQATKNIISFIDARDYTGAESAANRLIVDFSGDADLRDALFLFAEKYENAQRFEEAKRVYRQAIQKYSDNPWANKARLGVSRVEVLSLIMTEDFAGAQKAIDKMTSDFGENTDLAETLYWIAERYRWFSKFDEEKGLYRQIIQKNSESPYASKAILGISRAEVMSFIMAKDYASAKEALDKMAAKFAGHPDLPETLFWIAERYEWFNNKFQDAKGVYQRIIQGHSDSPYAGRARLCASMAEVKDIIISRDYKRSEEALNKAAAEFSGHPDWPRLITLVGEQYYKEGLSMESEGLSDLAVGSFERAVKIWDGLISEHPDSEMIPEVCCWAGDCYYKMGKHEDSIRCFEKVVDKYPAYKYAWYAQFVIGSAYQKMKDKGLLSESDADAMTKTAYQQLILKWPGCDNAGSAQTWLNEHNSK